MNNPDGRALTRFALAWANICSKPYRSLGLAAIVAVSAFIMFGGSLISGSVNRGVDSLALRLGADLMVVPRGYDASAQTILLRGEPSSFYLEDGIVDEIRSLPGVEKAVPQLYLATLESTCCAYPIQIIGYDAEEDFVIGPWMETSRVISPQDNEIVVGNLIVSPVGAKTFFFGDVFRVSARLDRTGMGFDTSVFMPLRRARRLLREGQSQLLKGVAERSVSSVLVKLRPGTDPGRVIGAIRRELGREYALDVVVSRDIVSGLSSRIGALVAPLRLITAFFWLGSLCALFIFHSVLTGERRRELALLRAMGATRRYVGGVVLLESVILGGGGAATGLILGIIVCLPFQAFILREMGLPYLALSAAGVLRLAGATVFAGIVVGTIACLPAVVCQNRREIYLDIRGGERE